MHFYESSIITTKDGLHCQVYGNEHPLTNILIKPKYIPTDKILSDALQFRFISGKKMNRLNLWADKDKLKNYIESFKDAYPNYIFKSPLHDKERLFFSVPVDAIERIFFPRRGLKELMGMPFKSLDEHLKLVHKFVKFILKSGISMRDLGVTYSTLMGHYLSNISDINIVVYGKENFWLIMKYLETAQHPLLRWKNEDDWSRFYNGRNRFKIFNKGEFVRLMSQKKSEGYFGDVLFILFGVEKEEEAWFRWGDEKYFNRGFAEIEGIVKENHSSIVRPGCYEITKSKIINSEADYNVKIKGDVEKLVFYSRDYCMLAKVGEKVRASGILEEVKPLNGKPYLRLVVGYFDSYLSERREKEFIKVI